MFSMGKWVNTLRVSTSMTRKKGKHLLLYLLRLLWDIFTSTALHPMGTWRSELWSPPRLNFAVNVLMVHYRDWRGTCRCFARWIWRLHRLWSLLGPPLAWCVDVPGCVSLTATANAGDLRRSLSNLSHQPTSQRCWCFFSAVDSPLLPCWQWQVVKEPSVGIDSGAREDAAS